MPFSATLAPLTASDSRFDAFSASCRLITPGAGDQTAPGGQYFKYFVASTAGNVTFLPYKDTDGENLTMTVTAGMVLPGRIRRITAATATVHGWFD